MDKNAIKKFAIWARRELLERVSQRALYYGISEKSSAAAEADSVDGRLLTHAERRQRQALLWRIERQGYRQVMEEAAYTWFNRLTALRFLEVNEYLPSKIRVFTDAKDSFAPELLEQANDLELPGLDRKQVFAYKEANDNEALYRYLLILQCNALNDILPGMFQPLQDYTELLCPDNLLRESSVVAHLVADIPTGDWKEAVEIIGWLYQYYNSEPKDQVFADLKKNIKIDKATIPAATQLFTPDWIVRYMVENSLGRIAVEKESAAWGKLSEEERIAREKDYADNLGWQYYLPEAAQEQAVRDELDKQRQARAGQRLEEIRVVDPCMGSGHILAYLFDVLFQLYEKAGYPPKNAVRSILQNNLYGLDIDDRAAQLAYFTVMMKGRRYDKRFFDRHLQPQVYAIQESNGIKPWVEKGEVNGVPMELDSALVAKANKLIATFQDAKLYGSLINVSESDYTDLLDWLDKEWDKEGEVDIYYRAWLEEMSKTLPVLAKQAEVLAQKYSCVVTNPPYMGMSNGNNKLGNYAKNNYPNSKSDLFAIFMERCGEFLRKNGYQAMITMQSWMFLSTYDKLREKIFNNKTILNMIHLGPRAFDEISGEVVQTTAFALGEREKDYQGVYVRLIDGNSENEKAKMLLSGLNRFVTKQENFAKIPGTPVAYWVSEKTFNAYGEKKIEKFYVVRNGISTGDNTKYLRLWTELDKSRDYWKPCNKGGEYRKWYGNNDYMVFWKDGGKDIRFSLDEKGRIKARLGGIEYSFSKGIEMSRITSGKKAFRYSPGGFVYESSTNDIYAQQDNEDLYIVLGYCNSVVTEHFLNLMNPTINVMPEDLRKLPFIVDVDKELIVRIVKENIEISQNDWDSFETSWDFKTHPLIPKLSHSISEEYSNWEKECNNRFYQLKSNEEELNRIFIDIYGLNDELSPEVDEKDVTVRKADLQRDIKSLLSYSIGCLFGRYSLDEEGLIYAGGEWQPGRYRKLVPDPDNIIPLAEDTYLADDIMPRFKDFLTAAYGRETLRENMQFIAEALGGRGTAEEIVRRYFLTQFFADHVQTYKKRPIYWLLDSGKKNAFKCLIYLHRYRPDTLARVRTNYVHEYQARYRTELDELTERLKAAAGSEHTKLSKRIKSLQEKLTELAAFEERLHTLADQNIELDLDDGVKVNYAKLQPVLAKLG